jgi:two-component system OmpR family sensor kinase
MSLRARLLAAVGTIAILALGISSVATYSLLQSYLNGRADQSLQIAARAITHAADSGQQLSACGRRGVAAQPPTANGKPFPKFPGGRPDLGSVVSVSYEVRPGTSTSANTVRCAAYVQGHPYTPSIPGAIAGLTRKTPVNFSTGSTVAGGPEFRVHASILADGSTLVVGIPLNDTYNTLHKLLVTELVVAAIALLVAILAGFFFVRLGLRPLDDVESTAVSIIDGRLSDRIPVANQRSEVGRLSTTLNTMLDQIEGAFGARDSIEVELRKRDELLHQFVADASHELRTPITAIAAYAELIDHWGSRDQDQLSEVLSGIRVQAQRMEQLVNDLLTLARMDERAPSEHIRVELVGCCTEVIATALTVKPQWPVTFGASESLEVMGSSAQLHRVIENLLANVRAHTPEGTTTRVRVVRDGDDALITVSDDGPGMSDETMEHAFDRFYRSDPGRDRAQSGSGLGLSIVAAMVSAHGGSVSLSRAQPNGTRVTLRFPLADELTA